MRRLLLVVLALSAAMPASAGAIVDNGGGRNVKILGGTIAAPGQFPWMAALVDSSAKRAIDGTFCGGSVIAPQVVLTAHHCIDGTEPGQIDVVVGRNRLSQDDQGQRIAVTRIVAYPNYNGQRVTGDIALLKLATPTTVQAIPIAHPADDGLIVPGTDVVAMGWGTTSEGGTISDDLRYVHLKMRPQKSCHFYAGYSDAQQICVGSDRAGQDTCQGDSGGPVLSGSGLDVRLVGTVSYGNGCGHKGVPGVYAKTSRYSAWIDQNTAALNGGAVTPPPPADAPRVVIGRISCAQVFCDVFLRTTGRAPAGGIVLDAVRRKRPGHKAVDRAVFAKQLTPTRWRAHINLPYGHLILYAIPLTAAQNDYDGAGDVQRVLVYSG